jgi:hypothetical protein
VKPLFIPLKAQFFDAFADGSKGEEYRAYGPRWNEATCVPGRPAVLSRGYGKHQRIHCTVAGFRRIRASDLPQPTQDSVRAIFGDNDIAAIAMRDLSGVIRGD